MDGGYYESKRSGILSSYDALAPHLCQALTGCLGREDPHSLVADVRRDLDCGLDRTPYIGGDSNRLTENLIWGLWTLYLYRRLQAAGASTSQIGSVIRSAVVASYAVASPDALEARANNVFSHEWKNLIAAQSHTSKLRTYRCDWVYDYVEGDGVEFDYGIDYTECGLHKYFTAEGAGDLVRHLCTLDFVGYGAIGAGLERHTTVADGAARCDFRFKRGRPSFAPDKTQGDGC